MRLGPALLVLLLSVRVATAAAVACQHDLADAARAAERAQEALRIEAAALGGELCLAEDAPAHGTDHDQDGPHLSSPCPFFKSPVTLVTVTTDATPHEASVSPLWQSLTDQRPHSEAPWTSYQSRAPPHMAGEVLARAPRSRPVHAA
jgi:hypothetical protein